MSFWRDWQIYFILFFSLCATFLQGWPAWTGPYWSPVFHTVLTWITRLLHPLPLIPVHNLRCSQQSGHSPMFLWGGFSVVPPQGCAEPSCLVGAWCFLCMSASSSWLAQIGEAAFAGWRCCSLTHRHWAGRKVLNTHICSSAFCLPSLELGWMSSYLKHTQLSLSSLSIPAEGAAYILGIYKYMYA